MNPELLLLHFDRLAEAPGGIPRLRRFILDLAVRGKLVEQDPNDEPADELLKKIAQEKARLIREGTIKKGKELPPISPQEIPFEIPQGWVWARLASIGDLSGGMTPSKHIDSYWKGDINWFSPKDFRKNRLENSELKISHKAVKETRLQLYAPGSLLMVARSGILKRTFPVAINDVVCTVNQDIKVLTPYHKGLERFLQIMFFGMTDYILKELVKTGTTVQSLKYDEFATHPFPLPPLAEQHRIVRRVDELMALCDELEEKRKSREEKRDLLVAATLHGLNAGAPEEELPERARFLFEQLPRLSTRREHIRKLREAILGLAVRGKLTEQDPNDEPAAELLKKIAQEKARLTREGTIKKGKELPPISPQEIPFELPQGWEVVRLKEIAIKLGAGSTPKGGRSVYLPEGIPFLRSQNVYNDGLRLNDVAYISQNIHNRMSGTHLRPYDILLNITGASIGRSAIVPEDFQEGNVSQHVAIVRLFLHSICSFIHLSLISPFYQQLIMNVQVGVSREGLSMQSLSRFPLLIPPLAEQHRIVRRVDELMALCDELEKELESAGERSVRFLEGVLHAVFAEGQTAFARELLPPN